jgi:hypothetical protein
MILSLPLDHADRDADALATFSVTLSLSKLQIPKYSTESTTRFKQRSECVT